MSPPQLVCVAHPAPGVTQDGQLDEHDWFCVGGLTTLKNRAPAQLDALNSLVGCNSTDNFATLTRLAKQSNTVTGPQTYHYGTELYCWIRGATLARRRLQAARQLTGAFSGNSFKLVKIGSPDTTTTTTTPVTTTTTMDVPMSAAQRTTLLVYPVIALVLGLFGQL